MKIDNKVTFLTALQRVMCDKHSRSIEGGCKSTNRKGKRAMTEATLAHKAEITDRIRGAAAIFLAGTALGGAAEATFAADNALARDKVHYSNRYEALGDSVASGLGLPLSPDASAEDQACGRSPQAYPTRVAHGLGIKLGKNLACQGAVVDNLTAPQVRDGLTIKPQIDEAFAAGVPSVLSITIGANNLDYPGVIAECFTRTNCATRANTQTVNSQLAILRSDLQNSLRNIQSRPGRAPKTIATGYYRPISGQCVGIGGITPDEVAWLNNRTDDFNRTLKSATRKFSFTRFANVSFTRHDACSEQPWVQRLDEPKRLHPNADGQQVIAEAVIRAAKR
jgi:lysophospholipase L1-like esterase